jgi:hypothetical protein
MEVVMVKRARRGAGSAERRVDRFALAQIRAPPDPVFLATAVEIVLQAGAIQLARRASGFTSTRRARSISSPKVDLECELMCRAILAERLSRITTSSRKR